MMIPAFSASTNPTSTQVTAAIVHADARIDSFIGTASVAAAVLTIASCMIVSEMIERGKKYLVAPDEVTAMRGDILTPAVEQLLREAMEEAADVALVVTSQEDYQTRLDPDDFV
jgi:hypothetical protein